MNKWSTKIDLYLKKKDKCKQLNVNCSILKMLIATCTILFGTCGWMMVWFLFDLWKWLMKQLFNKPWLCMTTSKIVKNVMKRNGKMKEWKMNHLQETWERSYISNNTLRFNIFSYTVYCVYNTELKTILNFAI